jgi:hypothetical protein
MKITFRCIQIILWIGLTTAGYGRQNHDRREIREDKKDLAFSSVSVADDRRDFDRLSDLVMRWDDMRKGGDSAELRQVQKKIAGELRRDLKETAVEVQRAKREAAGSAADKNEARRELRRERRDRDGDRRALRDDRRDFRGEKRDLRGDVKDANQAEEMLRKKREVAGRLIALQKLIDSPGKSGDKALQNQQLGLLEEYLKLSREEIKAGIREKAEDRREIREDRREKREDRRD